MTESRSSEPVIAVDWSWYQETLRRFKAIGLDALRADADYIRERVSSLQNVTDWNAGDALDALNLSMLEVNRLIEDVKTASLKDIAPPEFWIPRCPRCDGSGYVTVVTERESSFDFSTGQDRDVEVCPVCGLGAV